MGSRRGRARPARERGWEDKHEDAFTHDRARHRKALRARPAHLPPPIPPEAVVPNAVVISHTGQWAFVRMDGSEQLCLIDEALGDVGSTVLAPGDAVQVEFWEDQPMVRGVAPRRTKLSRLARLYSREQEQVIAANVDTLVIVASALRPRFKPGLVDRYLVAAGMGGVTPVLVLNKMDLVDEEPEQVLPFRELGLEVVSASCVTGLGIDTLRGMLHGKLSVMAGHSGVGKSSLLNALDPTLDLATREVSDSNEKGRHTTSAARLYELAGGIRVIDTPGVRHLGLWGISPGELDFYFPEIGPVAAACRFRDCTHAHEPGCAVREAVERNTISRLRYDSYVRIRESLT